MSHRPEEIAAALRHLGRGDAVIRELIRRVGPFGLRLERNRFRMLVRSIISQQISTHAARSIRRRLERLVAPKRLTPRRLATLSRQQLRAAGLSPQKAGSLVDLARQVDSDRLILRRLGRLSDTEVISVLTAVKGIGLWTAQMFLIFSLGRLDVLPHGDLGIRSAIRRQYRLEVLPDKPTCERISIPWRPYASVASWYLWRSGELDRDELPAAAGYPV